MVKHIDTNATARQASYQNKKWIVIRVPKNNSFVYSLYEPTFESDPLRSKKPFRTMLGLTEPVGSWRMYFMPPAKDLKDSIEWSLEELNRQTNFRAIGKNKTTGFKERVAKLGKFSLQDEDVRLYFSKLMDQQAKLVEAIVKLAYPEIKKGAVKNGLFFFEPMTIKNKEPVMPV